MFLSSSDLKVQVEDVLGRYFEKMYNLLSNGENLDEIANVLTIGQAYTRLPTSFDWDEIVYKCIAFWNYDPRSAYIAFSR